MALSWNVRDTQVFDELAVGLRETEWMIKDIQTETDHVFVQTIQSAEQAKSKTRARISALETEISDLKRRSENMRRRGEPTESIEAEITRKTKELNDRHEDLAKLERIADDATDSKISYDKSYDKSLGEYKDGIGKTCSILNQFGILLTQSLMG